MSKEKKGSWPPSELEEKALEFTKTRYEQVPSLSDFNYERFQRSLDELHNYVPAHRIEKLFAPIADSVRELSEQRHIDVLTSLPNRRALTTHLRQEFFSARRAPRHPLAYMLVDIDHFKQINDTYGHPVGDTCLRLLGYIFREHKYPHGKKFATELIRGDDYVCRYGGEEFSILLSKVSSQEGAYYVAERIRRTLEICMQDKKWLCKAFKQLGISLPGLESVNKADAASYPGTYLYRDGGAKNQTTELPLPIHEFPSYTVSLGVCFYNPDTEPAVITPDVLITAADKALYESKKRGRNRVTMWEGSLEELLDNNKK